MSSGLQQRKTVDILLTTAGTTVVLVTAASVAFLALFRARVAAALAADAALLSACR